MATLGYARTSTRDQEAGLQAQIRDLIAAGCAGRDIHTEQASSVRQRPELDLLRRRILRPGDDLVVTRLDRLARSARDTLALAEEFGQRGVMLKILDPAMTIEPPGSGRSRASPEANGSMAGAMSRMILTVMAAMAQLEREIMVDRGRAERRRLPNPSRTRSGQVPGEVFVHLEHGHLVLAEDALELVVGQDLTAVVGVLQVVGLDVVPYLAHHLAPGQRFWADHRGQRLGWLQRPL